MRLQSGLEIDDPQGRLLRFSREEYNYYDGVFGSDPNRVEPIDVLATWSVNSNIYRVDPDERPFIDPAAKMRAVHRGLATNCDRLLAEIPEDADLLSFDTEFEMIGRLLGQAIRTRGVGIPVATKVLHRKRRNLIPMLDSIVSEYYLTASEVASLKYKKNWNNRQLVVSLALKALAMFREDLRNGLREVESYRQILSAASYFLSPTRILEILIWTKKRGLYGP